MLSPTWSKNGVDLYLGDCRNIIAYVKADCVVTDPPYGINGSSGTIGKSRWHKTRYVSDIFDDTLDTLDTLDTIIVPAVMAAIDSCGRGIVTPGNRGAMLYPVPSEIGMIHQPATVSLGPWGRMQSQPILFYGRDPMIGKKISDTVYRMVEPPSCDEHPCSKPLGFCLWAVSRVSLETETILDPFMGSGTTGVACVRLGRRFIGCEIEERYFSIAVSRIEKAMEETSLLDYGAKQEQMEITSNG